jgi:hypothetical protein
MPGKTIIDELIEKSDFERLVKLYRKIAKLLDYFKKLKSTVPPGTVDTTIFALEGVLKQLLGAAKRITGEDITHEQLTIPQFGMAESPGTTQVASAQPPETWDDLVAIAGQADDTHLDPAVYPWLFSDPGAVASSMGSFEPPSLDSPETLEALEFMESMLAYDASQPAPDLDAVLGPSTYAGFRPSPVAGERDLASRPGCLDALTTRIAIAAAAIVGAIVLIAVGLFFFLGGDGDDDGAESATGDRDLTSVFSLWPETTAADLAALEYLADLTGLDPFVFDDPLADFFTSFDQPVVFESPHVEMVAGGGFAFQLPQDWSNQLDCGATAGQMDVVCLSTDTGTPAPGDYYGFVMTLNEDLATRQAGLDYRYNVFLQQQGQPVFPSNPQFPLNTLQNVNQYLTLQANGPDTWQLACDLFTGRGFDDCTQVPQTSTGAEGPRLASRVPIGATRPAISRQATDAAANVRAVVGGHTVLFLIPVELCGEGCLYNLGTNVHPVGEEYTPDNVALDVIGTDPTEPLRAPADLRAASSPEPSAGASPAAPTNTPPAAQATPSPTPADEATLIRAAIPEYAGAIAAAQGAYVVDHLDQSAIEHWGEAQCQAFFGALAPDPTFNIEVITISGPAPWTWQIYGETIGTIPDAYTADIRLSQAGQTVQTQAHFAWDDEAGKLRVFSPCVPPPGG